MVIGSTKATVNAEHEVQAGLYAMAVQEITGRLVRQAVLLFLQPKAEHVFADIDRLMARGREATSRNSANAKGVRQNEAGTLLRSAS